MEEDEIKLELSWIKKITRQQVIGFLLSLMVQVMAFGAGAAAHAWHYDGQCNDFIADNYQTKEMLNCLSQTTGKMYGEYFPEKNFPALNISEFDFGAGED